MNRLNKSKLPEFLHSREGWVAFMEKNRSREPHIHQIEPTNHCPYTCVMCPRTNDMSRSTGFMEMEVFKKIVDEIATFKEPVRSKEIELFHFGESLLHPEFDDMIKYVSDRNLHGTLSVNPPHLKEKVMKKVIDAKPYRVIISFDGFDNESYREIRGKAANFDLAIKNIDRLIEYHKETDSKSIIEIRMIRMKINQDAVDKFASMWEGIDNVNVVVRDFFPWTEERLVELGEVEHWDSFKPCKFPWDYVVVQYNGDVVACCRDYDGHNVMGNIKNESLVEIWNGPKYDVLRKQHETGCFGDNEFCKKCSKIYYKED